jgi:hypothetical protein
VTTWYHESQVCFHLHEYHLQLGSSTTTDAMLLTIMKRLNAMDNKLKALAPLHEKVTMLEASIEELGAQ